jgi:predicted AlkP superfamily pyrophosphatase or phosphodiesterase
VGARYRIAPFDPKIREAAKVAQILAWLDLPPGQRPRLVMSWWHGADAAGHAKGPDHPDVVKELSEQDHELGALLAGLDARSAWNHTTLIVVSDHGMTRADHAVPIAAALRDANVRAHLELGTSVAHVFLEDPAELEHAERALAGLAGAHVDRRDALPASLHMAYPDRTGDLVVRVEPPYTFATTSRFAAVLQHVGGSRGMHGYSPDLPDMGGIFLATGRGVPRGARPASVRMIDVAPTVARLLGIDPPRQAEGRAIDGIGDSQPGEAAQR